ncbi:MAG: hypothetical protein WA446_10640 [Steroidobacteraceae bacterium]
MQATLPGMLPPEVTNCIRESIEANLPLRDQSVADSLQRSASEFIARGTLVSSMMLQARARIGCDELAVRTDIMWGFIMRCHRVFGMPLDDQLADDLQQQLREHLARQSELVIAMVDSRPSALGQQWQPLIRATVEKRHDELFRKFSNEARLYALAAAQPAKTEPSTYSFHGPVGAVQTGSYASAHIHIDAAGGTRLAEALEQLRTAIPQATGMTDDQRSDSQEVIGDLIAAARAPKPNGSKLTGLLNGVAVSVQTVASLRGAWDFVLDAARLIGIPVP